MYEHEQSDITGPESVFLIRLVFCVILRCQNRLYRSLSGTCLIFLILFNDFFISLVNKCFANKGGVHNDPFRQSFFPAWDEYDFFALFMVKLLIAMGYDLDVIWSQLRTRPVTDEEMTLLISPIIRQIQSRISEGDITPSFLERFTHAFFNCTSQSAETLFQNWTANYLFWRNLMNTSQLGP